MDKARERIYLEYPCWPEALILEWIRARRRRGVLLHSNILLPQAAPRGSSNYVKRYNIAVFYSPSSQSNDCVSSKYFAGVADERFILYVFSVI